MSPNPRANEDRWPKRRHRRLANFIALIQYILGGNKRFQPSRDSSRNKNIEREVAAQAELVLIVVKLRAGRSAL